MKIENIIKLFDTPSSDIAIKNAFLEIVPKNKREFMIDCIILLLSMFIAYIISIRTCTVSISKEIVGDLNAVVLAIFAIVFTGYTLFQALADESVLMRMTSCEKNEKTYLQISNDYFLNVMLLNIVAILCNVIALLFLKIIPKDFILFSVNNVNEIISCILLTAYLFYQLKVIIEIKSFIFNIYQFFNISAGSKIYNMIENGKHSE